MDYISNIIDVPNKLSTKFEISELSSGFSFNVKIMKWANALFSKDGLRTNVSSYILIIFISIFLLSILIFIKFGYSLIQNDIKNILESKKDTDKRKNNIQKAKTTMLKSKNNFKKNKRKINSLVNFPPKKNKIKKIIIINDANSIQDNT